MTLDKMSLAITGFTTLAVSLLLLGTASPCHAQTSSPPPEYTYLSGTSAANPVDAPQPVVAEQPAVGEPSNPAPPQASTASADDAWHFAVSPYLWFPGVHGTAVGPNDNGLGFRASPSDLLSHFQIGLMGAVEVRYKRIVTSMDIFWLRLQDNTAIPLPPAIGHGAIGANIHAT